MKIRLVALLCIVTVCGELYETVSREDPSMVKFSTMYAKYLHSTVFAPLGFSAFFTQLLKARRLKMPVEIEEDNIDHGPYGIEIPVETYRMENGTSLVLSFILRLNYNSTVFTAGMPLYQTVTAHMVCTSGSVACSFRQYSILPRLPETPETLPKGLIERIQQNATKPITITAIEKQIVAKPFEVVYFVRYLITTRSKCFGIVFKTPKQNHLLLNSCDDETQAVSVSHSYLPGILGAILFIFGVATLARCHGRQRGYLPLNTMIGRI